MGTLHIGASDIRDCPGAHQCPDSGLGGDPLGHLGEASVDTSGACPEVVGSMWAYGRRDGINATWISL